MKQGAADQQDTYRMSALVSASGVSRDMIKYYLRAGLLPPAEKPRQNLSLYTANHLSLIGLIQKFQEQTKLSLPEIAKIFGAASYDASNIEIELLSDRHSISGEDNIIPLQTQPGKHGSLNLPAAFLQQLVDASLLSAEQKSEDDEQLAGLLWAAHDADIPLEFFETVREKLAELSDLEVKTLLAIKRPELNFNETVEHVTHANRIIDRWMIAEKSRQIRQQFQRTIDNSERATSTLLETIYRPSHLFRQRYRVEDLLSRLTDALDAEPSLIGDAYAPCASALLLGEYRQAVAWAEAALSKDAKNDIATAFLAIAHGLQNDADTAFAFGNQLEDSPNKHPIVLKARILALLLKASKLRGVANNSELIKHAGELFLESAAETYVEQPEVTLLLARANLAFPDFANSQGQAISALDSMLQSIARDDIELPVVAIDGMHEALKEVYRIYALYYLGELHRESGDPATSRHCFEQVLHIDPASNFGEKAYLQLGAAR